MPAVGGTPGHLWEACFEGTQVDLQRPRLVHLPHASHALLHGSKRAITSDTLLSESQCAARWKHDRLAWLAHLAGCGRRPAVLLQCPGRTFNCTNQGQTPSYYASRMLVDCHLPGHALVYKCMTEYTHLELQVLRHRQQLRCHGLRVDARIPAHTSRTHMHEG